MLQFWRDEYPLNAAIKNYRKPYVALIDGIVMGGGVGVSVHGSHRVAGDRFPFAMPEVGIGFFPDVGATWFLPRMPGELGTYCALTGERFDAADAVDAGIATHRVPSARFPALLEGAHRHGVGRCGARRICRAGGGGQDRARSARRSTDCLPATASKTFSPRSTAKRAAEPNGPQKPPPRSAHKSPLSLKLALAQVRRGKTMGFRARACAPNSA